MGKKQWFEEDDFDWDEIEKATRNFKGSVDEIEDILIDDIRPHRKKRKSVDRFYDEEL